MAEGRPGLRELARRLGIEDGYVSALDREWVSTTDATREALVGAMGFDAQSDRAALDSLARLTEAEAPAPPSPRRGDVASPPTAPGVFGIVANLYSVRSQHNWGFGHLGDLEAVVERAAAEGAAFVGVNPLHVTLHRAGRFSPYDPVSRLFRDPLYLDPERVPEFAACAPAQRMLASTDGRRRLETLRRAERLDVAALEAFQFAVLRPLHRAFCSGEGDAAEARRRAFATYCEQQGARLKDFSTFQALGDRFEADSGGRAWTRWPGEYQRPDTSAVHRFREQSAGEVDWHAWLQFELDRQLAVVAGNARRAGMTIGLYTDLAIGSGADGSDVWSSPELFARGVRVGAPPDAFNPDGQDWSFPPLDPHALRRDGYAFWRSVLDANLEHAGALRVDHALALRRLFWIPEGATPHEGAYVRYPTEDLLTVLLEAGGDHRAQLIAEDLGTVPEGFSEELQARGLLTSRVLPFERDADGFRAASRYPQHCLATANTHDLPPLAALEGDTDLVLRRRVGQLPDDAALERARQERRAERQQLRERLVQDGLLPSATGGADSDEFAAAVTAFLCATPARWVGVSLDDLAGEEEPINLPGVGPDRHPSWTRRMSGSVEAVFESPRARRMLAAVPPGRRERRDPGRRGAAPA